MGNSRLAVAIVLVGALAACGDGRDDDPTPTATPAPSRTPTPRPTVTPRFAADVFAGVYDLHAASVQQEFSGEAIAIVSRADDGSMRVQLRFDVANDITLSGTFVGVDQLMLEGYGTFQGDSGFDVLGTGMVGIGVAGRRRISGSINGFTGFAVRDAPSPSIDFVLERPANPVVEPYAGRYCFDFAPSPSGCGAPSHAVLELSFTPDGRGDSTSPSADRGTGEVVFGTLQPGPCWLSPSGRLECTLEYRHRCAAPREEYAVESHFFALSGQLVLGPPADAAGAGRVEVNPFLYFLGGQNWTARR